MTQGSQQQGTISGAAKVPYLGWMTRTRPGPRPSLATLASLPRPHRPALPQPLRPNHRLGSPPHRPARSGSTLAPSPSLFVCLCSQLPRALPPLILASLPCDAPPTVPRLHDHLGPPGSLPARPGPLTSLTLSPSTRANSTSRIHGARMPRFAAPPPPTLLLLTPRCPHHRARPSPAKGKTRPAHCLS